MTGPIRVDAAYLAELVAIIVVSMLAIVAAYHAMQRPRLVLREGDDGTWRPTRRDFWQYVASMPFLMLLWAMGLQIILLFTNNGLTGHEIVAIAMALVIAVRILAHVSREHSHELAKSVPLTIITLLIVTSSGWRSGADFDRVAEDLSRTQVSVPSLLLLVLSEFVIAALWYWAGVRWWYPRGHDVPGLPRHARPEAPPDLTATRIRRRPRG